MQNKTMFWAAVTALILSILVVMLGAYTRLTDAGLGCPDWPGCYGQMVLPSADTGLQEAQKIFPQIPIETKKAWTEMVHRYAAGTLALLIFFIGFMTLYKRNQGMSLPWHIPVALMLLVLFQAALGMWTVTLKLLPVVVMAHLLGGMLIVAGLSRLCWQTGAPDVVAEPSWRPWVLLGLLIVFIQIALGGWVSSNYAGIACIGFPRCNGLWLPDLHFVKGFNLFSPVGANYQGGILDNEVRVSIQFIHRVGAVVTACYLLILSCLILIKSQRESIKITALCLIAIVLLQFLLGVINVIYLLPIQVAVAHNGVAALLLSTLFSLLHFTRRRLPYAY